MSTMREKIPGSAHERDGLLQSDVPGGCGDRSKSDLAEQRRSRKAAKDRDRKRKLYHTEEFRAKERIRRKKYRAANPEKERVRAKATYHRNKKAINARKAEWQRRNIEHVTAYRREYYANNKEWLLPSILEDRDRRDPSRVIRRITKELRHGGLEFTTAIKKIREQVDAINGRIGKLVGSTKRGRGRAASGGTQDRTGAPMCDSVSADSPNAMQCSEGDAKIKQP